MIWYNSCIKCGETTLFHFDYCADCIDPITEEIEFDAFEHGQEDAIDAIRSHSTTICCTDPPSERIQTIRVKDREWYSWHYIQGYNTILESLSCTKTLFDKMIQELETIHAQKQALQKCEQLFGTKYAWAFDRNLLNLIGHFVVPTNIKLNLGY